MISRGSYLNTEIRPQSLYRTHYLHPPHTTTSVKLHAFQTICFKAIRTSVLAISCSEITPNPVVHALNFPSELIELSLITLKTRKLRVNHTDLHYSLFPLSLFQQPESAAHLILLGVMVGKHWAIAITTLCIQPCIETKTAISLSHQHLGCHWASAGVGAWTSLNEPTSVSAVHR